MYIAPNSTIKILKGVPLDATYEHTIYYNSSPLYADAERTKQTNYFSGKAKYTLNNQMYQRVKRGWMRVEKRAEDLYDCNYLMFQNTAFGNKWFYAFIKSVEYINNEVSEIEYEIDVLQTWNFDYEFEKCFIERAHSSSDEPYENTQPENLNLGNEYVADSGGDFDLNSQFPESDNPMRIAILTNRKPSEGTSYPSTYTNNVYNACRINYFLASAVTAIDIFLDSLVEDDIVAVYQFPNVLSSTKYESTYSVQIQGLQFGNYTAHNKKLLSYPFCFLEVSNNAGETNIYKYEYLKENPTFAGFTDFKFIGVSVTEPCVATYPSEYRGISNPFDVALFMSNFPKCAWAGDAFKAWWAQNKNSYQTSLITSAISGFFQTSQGVQRGAVQGYESTGSIGGAVVGGIRGGIGSVVSTGSHIANMLAKVEDIKHHPNRTFGNAQTSTLNAAFRKYKFSFFRNRIKEEYARRIDDYFDHYGYAQNRIGFPVKRARTKWTYCKTIGCSIKGTTGVPADDARKICSIFDNGITHWINPDEIGLYSHPEQNVSWTNQP